MHLLFCRRRCCYYCRCLSLCCCLPFPFWNFKNNLGALEWRLRCNSCWQNAYMRRREGWMGVCVGFVGGGPREWLVKLYRYLSKSVKCKSSLTNWQWRWLRQTNIILGKQQQITSRSYCFCCVVKFLFVFSFLLIIKQFNCNQKGQSGSGAGRECTKHKMQINNSFVFLSFSEWCDASEWASVCVCMTLE